MQALVILPTYQEADNIEDVILRVRRAAPQASIMVVDDGSPDGTADIANAVGRTVGKVEVMRRSAKMGLGSAYRAGFQWGIEHGFDMLIEMDSDLSHDPASLPDIIAAVERGADLAIGSRYIPGGSIPHWSWHRRQLSMGGNRYAAAALRLDVADATSGFRAYRASILTKIAPNTRQADGYGFQIEMARLVAAAGGVITEVPIAFKDRARGESKMSWRIIVEAFTLVTLWGAHDRGRRLLSTLLPSAPIRVAFPGQDTDPASARS